MDGWEVYEDDPKTDAGARTIALDADTVQALKRHRAQQDKGREEWGSAWVETGRVFTRESGEMLHPANAGSSSCTRRSACRLSGSTTSAMTPPHWPTPPVPT
ncbi:MULTISPECIES: site-specific integrase [Streptomyces]|uniref:hypothetical protein n=1 Tax=Streptomyces TaxID=1883 RepID=UPI000A516708